MCIVDPVGRNLKRSALLAVAIAVTFVVGVGVLVAMRPAPIATPDFEWGVHIGDSFRYEIAIHGNYPLAGRLSHQTFEEMLLINGTTIRANVTSLPPLDGITNSSSFFSEVVNVSKVICVFDNGSEIHNDTEAILVPAISGCILPIGGWQYIDSLYQDEIPYFSSSLQLMVSRLYPDHFFFGYILSNNIDSNWGWYGNVSLSNGAPISVMWKNNHQYLTVYLELTLVDD